MDSFAPYLYNALGNQDAPDLCSLAIGLVSDVVRALEEKARPYTDTFMNYLLNNLRVSPQRAIYLSLILILFRSPTNFPTP